MLSDLDRTISTQSLNKVPHLVAKTVVVDLAALTIIGTLNVNDIPNIRVASKDNSSSGPFYSADNRRLLMYNVLRIQHIFVKWIAWSDEFSGKQNQNIRFDPVNRIQIDPPSFISLRNSLVLDMLMSDALSVDTNDHNDDNNDNKNKNENKLLMKLKNKRNLHGMELSILHMAAMKIKSNNNNNIVGGIQRSDAATVSTNKDNNNHILTILIPTACSSFIRGKNGKTIESLSWLYGTHFTKTDLSESELDCAEDFSKELMLHRLTGGVSRITLRKKEGDHAHQQVADDDFDGFDPEAACTAIKKLVCKWWKKVKVNGESVSVEDSVVDQKPKQKPRDPAFLKKMFVSSREAIG